MDPCAHSLGKNIAVITHARRLKTRLKSMAQIPGKPEIQINPDGEMVFLNLRGMVLAKTKVGGISFAQQVNLDYDTHLESHIIVASENSVAQVIHLTPEGVRVVAPEKAAKNLLNALEKQSATPTLAEVKIHTIDPLEDSDLTSVAFQYKNKNGLQIQNHTLTNLQMDQLRIRFKIKNAPNLIGATTIAFFPKKQNNSAYVGLENLYSQKQWIEDTEQDFNFHKRRAQLAYDNMNALPGGHSFKVNPKGHIDFFDSNGAFAGQTHIENIVGVKKFQIESEYNSTYLVFFSKKNIEIVEINEQKVHFPSLAEAPNDLIQVIQAQMRQPLISDTQVIKVRSNHGGDFLIRTKLTHINGHQEHSTPIKKEQMEKLLEKQNLATSVDLLRSFLRVMIPERNNVYFYFDQ